MRVVLLLLIVVAACGQEKGSGTTEQLDALAFQERISPDITLIDVRTPEEFSTGYIAGAVNLDFKSPSFKKQLDSLNVSGNYLLYCASGVRSGKALDLMKQKGFTKVATLEGGISAWNEQGLPLQKP